MKPALSSSFCETAALSTDSAKSSTTSTLLPFFSGAWSATADMSVATMCSETSARKGFRGSGRPPYMAADGTRRGASAAAPFGDTRTAKCSSCAVGGRSSFGTK
jgi:hypothetical protein